MLLIAVVSRPVTYVWVWEIPVSAGPQLYPQYYVLADSKRADDGERSRRKESNRRRNVPVEVIAIAAIANRENEVWEEPEDDNCAE